MVDNFSDNFNFQKLYDKFMWHPPKLLLTTAKMIRKRYVSKYNQDHEVRYFYESDETRYHTMSGDNIVYPYMVNDVVIAFDTRVALPTRIYKNSGLKWTKDNLNITKHVEMWMEERGITYDNFSEDDYHALLLHWDTF